MMNRRCFAIWFFAVASASSEMPAQQPVPAAETKPVRRALLVGVTKYPNLAERLQLEGPSNDAALLKQLLTRKEPDGFGFLEENVVVLTEAAGAKNAELLPTRANIEREFKKLAAATRPGDEVVILLGGHGSQQPEKADAAEPEIDGLDEIFLPRDVGPWSDTVGSVENAITDDVLGAWVTSIRDKKAFVWLIVDACHSGTMMRSDGVERARKTLPDDLKIPTKAIADAEAKAAKRAGPDKTRGGGGEPTALGLAGKPGIFALYAAQPTESTPERPMPPGAKDAPQHGVLTYTVCQVLTQSKTNGSPVSYRELAQRVHQQYAAWGRTGPTPMIEYPETDPDREVLGPGVWKDRARILLTQTDNGYKVDAGQLVGLTPGSILEVRPPAGMGDKVVGHVKVTGPRPTDSDVELCAYANLPAPKELPTGARCRIVFVDFGEIQLRVSVATHYPTTEQKQTPVPPELRRELLDKLKKLSKPTSLFRAVDQPRDAAWVLAPFPDGVISLMPTAGWAAGNTSSGSKKYGPVPTDDRMEAWLEDAFGRIARTEGLIALSSGGGEQMLRSGDLAPKMKIEIFLVDAANKPTGVTLPWPATDLTTHDKDKVRIKVTNNGRVPFDLTALYLDTDYGIGVLYPKGGASNRVQPGNSLTVPIAINGTTVGLEHVALLAVKSGDGEVNFASLAQKSPDKLIRDVRDTRGPGRGLGLMLAGRVYRNEEGSRGGGADDVENYSMLLVPWQVKGTPRPAPEKK